MTKFWSSDAKKLLRYVSDEDIFQLASTVCKGHLEFSSKNEAIEAIIAACSSPNELLRKKKLKREYILRYIWENNRSSETATSLPIKADKRQLIAEVLSLWGCGVEDDLSKSTPSTSSTLDDDPSDDQFDAGEKLAPPPNPDSSIMVEFAQKFIDWFYNLLNNSINDDDFGAQHFYGNCLLRLRCGVADDRNVDVEAEGGLSTAQQLKQFVLSQRLMFQPNLRTPHGFQATQESHGAILVKSNGTVHRRPIDSKDQLLVLGPYEQTFLVIEDPQSKTWKIQQTALMVKAEIALTNLSLDSS